MTCKAYLALGSNLEDRLQYLIEAIRYISLLKGVSLHSISRVYETEPVGYVEQDKFLNMVVCILTDIRPVDLLDKLLKIEGKLKRKRDIHWGPRTIDIDILLYGNENLNLPRLTVPHRYMLERAFVLVPLRDIYPMFTANGKVMNALIDECSDRESIVPFSSISMEEILRLTT